MGAEFKTGDLVWAKMKGFPHWPGQVTPPVDYLKAAPKKGMLCIFFFGTNNYAWIEIGSLKPYAEFKDNFCKNSKSPSFKKAVAQMEDFIAKSIAGRDDPNHGKIVNDIAKDAAIIQAATQEVNKKKSLKRSNSAKMNEIPTKKKKIESTEESVVDEEKEKRSVDDEAPTNGEENKEEAKKAVKKITTGKKFVRKFVSKIRSKLRPTKKKMPIQQITKINKTDKSQISERIPPTWDSPPSSKQSSSPPIMKVSVPKSSNTRRESYVIAEEKFMDNYFKQLSFGYNTLLSVFAHLKVQDLLSAGCVCTMWRDLANHPTLWKTVRLKNSQMCSFAGLANALDKHGTQRLDMRKVEFIPVDDDGTYMDKWQSFSEHIIKVDTLRSIEFCNCPALVVERLAKTNQMLESIIAQSLVGPSLSLDTFANLTRLVTLSVKSANGFTLRSDLTPLREIKVTLKHLSLTSISDLRNVDLEPIGDLSELETLELGDCSDLPLAFCSDILIRLINLQKLRLEKGQGDCHTCEILSTVRSMPHIDQLELVNFDVKVGFDKAIGVCGNIKKLLLIPTYISQSATSNHLVLSGVMRLSETLTYFLWGVTLELLRVTDLFVVAEAGDEPASIPPKGTECIPVIKPIPGPDTIANDEPMTDPPEVEVLSMPKLQRLLIEHLPNTRVKILKIPFHATWRQNIKESS